MNERITCADGFSMSVQASRTHYCSPRTNHAEAYTSVEVGFPSEAEQSLMPYIDYPDDSPTGTVYGWVPTHIVTAVIELHGGIVSGELPPMEEEE